MDAGGVDAEQAGNASHRHGKALARRIHGQRIAVPCSNDGMRLHGVVILRRGLILGVDTRRGLCKTCLHVAVMHGTRIADADCLRKEAFAGVETDARRLYFIARRQQCDPFGGSFQRLGDHHGDRLVSIANLIVLQQVEPEHEGIGLGVGIFRQRRSVGWSHDVDDAGVALRRVHIEKADAAAGDGADRQHCMDHSRADDCRRRNALRR